MGLASAPRGRLAKTRAVAAFGSRFRSKKKNHFWKQIGPSERSLNSSGFVSVSAKKAAKKSAKKVAKNSAKKLDKKVAKILSDFGRAPAPGGARSRRICASQETPAAELNPSRL